MWLGSWLDGGDLVLVLEVTLLLELVATGEARTLLSMSPCSEVEVVVGNDEVGDGTGKAMLVVVFITPAGRE